MGINMVYACVGICTKMASMQDTGSWPYLLWFGGAVAIVGIYALLKGTTLIFTMLIAALLFGEIITLPNILGSVIIIIGIVLLARS